MPDKKIKPRKISDTERERQQQNKALLFDLIVKVSELITPLKGIGHISYDYVEYTVVIGRHDYLYSSDELDDTTVGIQFTVPKLTEEGELRRGSYVNYVVNVNSQECVYEDINNKFADLMEAVEIVRSIEEAVKKAQDKAKTVLSAAERKALGLWF